MRHLSPSLWPLFSLKASTMHWPKTSSFAAENSLHFLPPLFSFYFPLFFNLSDLFSLRPLVSLPNLLFILLSLPVSLVLFFLFTPRFHLYPFHLARNLHVPVFIREQIICGQIFTSWHRTRAFNGRLNVGIFAPSGQKARVNDFDHCFTRLNRTSAVFYIQINPLLPMTALTLRDKEDVHHDDEICSLYNGP